MSFDIEDCSEYSFLYMFERYLLAMTGLILLNTGCLWFINCPYILYLLFVCLLCIFKNHSIILVSIETNLQDMIPLRVYLIIWKSGKHYKIQSTKLFCRWEMDFPNKFLTNLTEYFIFSFQPQKYFLLFFENFLRNSILKLQRKKITEIWFSCEM